MERQIYYHDTDAGGVVYYGNYLKFLEEARTEFLEQKGVSVLDAHKRQFFYAVRKCDLVYKAPAKYGDVITCDAVLTKMTAAQLMFDQTVRLKDGQTLLEAKVTLVSLNPDFKPTPIPDNVREKLS